MVETSKDIKNKKKAAQKEAAAKKKEEEEKQLQADIVKEFNDKQAKAGAAADPISKLKEWLVNPPFRCTDEKLKVKLDKVLS